MKTSPNKNKCKKAKWLSVVALQIAESEEWTFISQQKLTQRCISIILQ